MLEFFLNLDKFLTNSIVYIIPRNSLIDTIFLTITFDWLILILGILIFLILWHLDSKYTKQFITYFLASYIIVGFLVNIVIKNVIQRERPYIANQIETLYCPVNNSFPSGHSSGAFVGAVIFSYYDKKRKWLYYSLASLIALSRIYLHCHYFLDVFIGAFIGYIISKALLLNITDNIEN